MLKISILTAQMQNRGFHGCIGLEGYKYHQLRRIAQKHDANHLESCDK